MQYEIYAKENRQSPYLSWVENLDGRARRLHDAALKKIILGNRLNCKPIRSNTALFEIVIDFGPGYRIYCTNLPNDIFLVLSAGRKDDQAKDIIRAGEFLKDYLTRAKQERKKQ